MQEDYVYYKTIDSKKYSWMTKIQGKKFHI